MSKKVLQEQRKKRYFIDATKNLIQTDGVENIKVKQIADMAGFASGTLYNYFNSLDTLLFYCVIDYFDECYQKINAVNQKKYSSKEYLFKIIEAYSTYFIENTHVYQLIFLENLGPAPEDFGGRNFQPIITELLRNALQNCASDGYFSISQLEVLGRLISNTIHGNLLFFINQKHILPSAEVLKRINEEVLFLFKED